MEILRENSNIPKNVALILGFFDGIHAGHIDVINNTPNTEKVVVTFSNSPAEFFNKDVKYIYPREINYSLMEKFGVSYIYEQKFSDIVNLSADDYLEKLLKLFEPISITTGFNHTFGANRQGNPEFLEEYKNRFKYYCTSPTLIDDEVVSSTKIRTYIEDAQLAKANRSLTRNFSLRSKVIEGAKIGRKLGFPTANMKYPKDIVRLPYGVYKIKCFDKFALMNWGVKPTFNSEELIEVHIPEFEADLYNKELEIEILSKIRDEKRFGNLDELKEQIKRDIELCLK